MRQLMSLVLALAFVSPLALADDKDGPDEATLTKAFKDADVIFTAKVGKVDAQGMTNSIPASIFGKVTFKDVKALYGDAPETPTFSYSYREGSKQVVLSATDTVVVAVRQKAVTVVMPATEANLALATKARK
jgi:hypothetical protein